MKPKPCSLILAALLLLPDGTFSAQNRAIQVEWEYQQTENLAGFRLYLQGNPVCETTDPSAILMNCTVDAPDGESHFTLTAFFQDNSESPPSKPFFYIFSSSLKAVFSPSITEGVSPLPVTFDATSSSGNISTYDWLFGDGDTGIGNIVAHTYTSPGNYNVSLKVTDISGAVDHESATILVTTPSVSNVPPHAAISSSLSVGAVPLQVQFDGSSSSDPDGSIISFKWDTGDGGTITGPVVSYTYLTPGSFNATLTVIDDGGLENSTSTPVLVTAPPGGGDNIKPTAIISASKTSGTAPLPVSFDASRSHDPDGTIVNYSWNFGDGSSATGVRVRHTFEQPGTYAVTLRVTDNQGAQSQVTRIAVHVLGQGALPPPAVKQGNSMPSVINLLLNPTYYSILEPGEDDTEVTPAGDASQFFPLQPGNQ